MHIKLLFLKDFEFARPQLFAGLMLLGLLLAASVNAYRTPAFGMAFLQARQNGDAADLTSAHDGILMFRSAALSLHAAHALSPMPGAMQPGKAFGVIFCSPFILFGLWLGGALWWVTRRLYNNAGGYIALALFCSSPMIVTLSSRVNAEIIAAWGLFGIVYTAIGVAHTLYAPPRKWRPRTVLLGVAFGITAAAHMSTGLIGLLLAAFFMLYLAPGRRMASILILAEATIIALLVLWACYGFSSALLGVDLRDALRPSFNTQFLRSLWALSSIPLVLLLACSVLTFFVWPRTRYFGNWAPLLVFVLLAVIAYGQGDSATWALPFAFVFIGGIFADLLETRWRPYATAAAVLAIAGQAVTMIVAVRAR